MPLGAFHPAIQRWFRERLGEPTRVQERAWPAIRTGAHTLIAAPTGSGKTLAAFLTAIDALFARGTELRDETRVLYVSPLKALGNDVQKNLLRPLGELRELDPGLPEVRVLVRSGDTPQSERAAMSKRPPHILVTTPESLYILLTSEGGRALLSTVRTAILDEIHALIGDKRGSHLALSLERLEQLAGPVQRIGLSATQKPIEDVGRFLVGSDRECTLIDEGHLRKIDVAVEVPPSPLESVCSNETWTEIYERIAELIGQHRTTLVFVGTRKLAERAAAQLSRLCGEEQVSCHHSSLSKERRLDAETRLKEGRLRALVATASLELGIDIGDVDLAIQIGSTRSIATFLQRIGRSGHGVGRTPKGRVFPLTQDELVEVSALLRCVERGLLDRTPQPTAPLDILAQQIVAECAARPWDEAQLFDSLRRAWPYRELERAQFDAVVRLHSEGRRALLHRDGVNLRLRGTRRARLTAILCGGAIPDSTQYRVVMDPEGVFVGSIDEDFAIESTAGDVFQLGNTSWRVLKVEGGTMRVADARGTPPSLPFWVAEAPSRTSELSQEVGHVRELGVDREWLARESRLPPEAAEQLGEYLRAGHDALGATPTQECIVLERFFDESGGTQLVVHAPFGGRINRAFGLALRKRFCRRFGFELQAAANEDAIVVSLGPQHAFPLEEVFDYLRADGVTDLLEQAVLVTPMFGARWRWNSARSLAVERFNGGKKLPAPLLRMRTNDFLAQAFPQAAACGETLPPGDLEIPREHPIVAQTMHDCLHEAMDVDGLMRVLEQLRAGDIRRVAVETAEPSPFASSVLAVRPYGFLDDAPLEERRTQAVVSRRTLGREQSQTVGRLDPDAVRRVREEAWPDPRNVEEMHEVLTWIGYVTDAEAQPWQAMLDELAAAGRAVHLDGRWLAAESTRDEKAMLRGRMEALGPVFSDDPLLFELESEGCVLRTELDGRKAWCDRRLLARIQRYTLERLRAEIEPVSGSVYRRFLLAWQHVLPDHQLEGPAGVARVVAQLAGFELPSVAWEKRVLAARVKGYRPDWLDQLALSGEIAWGRLWGAGRCALRSAPISFFPREQLEAWLGLTADAPEPELTWPARAVLDALRARGPLFQRDLEKTVKLLPSDLERGLVELIGLGLLASDSFASVRHFLRPAAKRRELSLAAGRWSLLREHRPAPPEPEFVARALLARYGIVFRAALERERQPVPWRDLARALRLMELRGEVRGGRFVAGFSGEQFALPEAIPLLRKLRKTEIEEPRLSPLDPAHVRLSPLEPRGSRASESLANAPFQEVG
jgi:ATP-dependent helicase Lhr and Lhr-like helicase